MRSTIVHDFVVEAAHYLPNVPEGHKCRRLHGHNYRIELHVHGPITEPYGWVMDFGELEAAARPLLTQLDHHLLNEVPGLDNPTAENIAAWLCRRLAPTLPLLEAVVVHENDRVRSIVRRVDALDV